MQTMRLEVKICKIQAKEISKFDDYTYLMNLTEDIFSTTCYKCTVSTKASTHCTLTNMKWGYGCPGIRIWIKYITLLDAILAIPASNAIHL